MAASIRWEALLEAALGGLRLSPETFWALTPFEARLLLGGEVESAGREDLRGLMARFPDPQGGDHGR